MTCFSIIATEYFLESHLEYLSSKFRILKNKTKISIRIQTGRARKINIERKRDVNKCVFISNIYVCVCVFVFYVYYIKNKIMSNQKTSN